MANFTNIITYNIYNHNLLKIMDARTQRRLRRAELREKCLKKEAEKRAQKIKRKNVKVAFREQSRKQALTLKSVVDRCYSSPSIKACFKSCLPILKEINDELRKKDLVVMPMWQMEHSSDINISLKKEEAHSLIYAEVLERVELLKLAHLKMDDAEFNWHSHKIRQLLKIITPRV